MAVKQIYARSWVQIGPGAFVVNKEIGETPLECLKRFRAKLVLLGTADETRGICHDGIPMTYAGRLDPMAEGKLIILVGDECKNKEKYLGFDKGYEVEVLFGVSTDTGDTLGMITEVKIPAPGFPFSKILPDVLESFRGKSRQEYPAYSSKTVGGEQLHVLARKGSLPETMPATEVEIYSIGKIGSREISGGEMTVFILQNIAKVAGDFRQDAIAARWRRLAAEQYPATKFTLLKILVRCSSGTYMRSLAEKIGAKTGMPAVAFSIKRTNIGTF